MRFAIGQNAARALSISPGFQRPLSNERQGEVSEKSLALKDLPGGTPMSLCPASKSTDLFNITSVEVTKQPIYMYVCILLWW